MNQLQGIKNYLVVGTDNLPETYTGYFTKHGDGAADILYGQIDIIASPIVYIAKSSGVFGKGVCVRKWCFAWWVGIEIVVHQDTIHIIVLHNLHQHI